MTRPLDDEEQDLYPRGRRRVRRRARALREFLRTEAGGAVVLLAATVVALLWANLITGYEDFWHGGLTVGVGDLAITEDLRHWVNDGLMAVFFFVVGLEIKRELVEGELRDPRAASLPVLAALGGLVLPALIYLAINAGGEGAGGWGIPVATDIAFAVGVLALIGSRVPSGLKVFLLSVAIADDIGAILIIAVAYSEGISAAWLGAAVASFLLIFSLRRVVTSPWAYVPLALFAWVATLESGVHATIAGVLLGLLTPAGEVGGRRVLDEHEHRFHPVSTYAILPVFALANAGVVLSADALRTAVASPVSWGILIGLLAGKTLGISAATWIAVRTRVGRLPLGVELRHIAALAPVAGIGFTVSLFIADLTFDDGGLLAAAKVGVLAGSVVSGVVGAFLLLRMGRHGRAAQAADT